MMSSILPVVFFTHCRCGPEMRPFFIFLPGPVLSEYLSNTGVPSRLVCQCLYSAIGFWWRNESRIMLFNCEVSFSVVGDGPAFVGVQCFEVGELFAAVGAAWGFFAGVYVLVFPVWAEFLRCWCCHRGLPPLRKIGRMVGFLRGWPWWSCQ